MRIAIVGNGAVGSALLAMFSEARIATTLAGRSGIDTSPKVVEIAGMKREVRAESLDLVKIDLWIFAVKAYDLKSALETQQKFISPTAVVAIICNGYIYEIAKDVLKKLDGVRIGSFTFGVKEGEKNHFVVSNPKGTLTWGPLRLGEAPSIIETRLLETLTFFRLVEDPFPTVRQKWLANIAINCLCAYFDLNRNGDLANYNDDVKKAVAEAYGLGEVLWGAWPHEESYYQQYVQELIALTANNENSMVRDLRLARKTEAAVLVGLVKNHARFPMLQLLAKRFDTVL